MEGLSFTRDARRTFHDVPYILTVSGDNETLSIEVEHAEDGRRWRSKFAARFIEEITHKTGSTKKFDIFVRMLLSALAQESDSVYIDVLTVRDLEMLRRHANPQGPPTTSTAGQSDKRYLILTYRAEFDKVHYPLPLPLDERSEEETLRAMVGRLRGELAEARQTIITLEQRASVAEPRRDDGVLASLQRQNSELNDALRVARRETEQLRLELRQRQGGAGAGGEAAVAEANKLKALCNKLQAELKAVKDDSRLTETHFKQCDRELRAEKQKTEKLQQQVRRLEEDKRAMGVRLQSSERRPSAERSRPSSRTPSADRARPSSRPASRPPSRTPSRPASGPPSRAASRASSVASSRERTPSPGSFARGSGPGGRGEPRPWAFQRSNSPADRPGAGRRTNSPIATLSPYRRPQAPSLGAGRRTPSPGQRGRERTPSPGQGRGGAGAARPPANLRDRGSGGAAAPVPVPAVASGSGRGPKPASTRYGSSGGSRPASASRGAVVAGARGADGYEYDGQRSGSRGPAGVRGSAASLDDGGQHRPGALFGLAANLGLGPGSFAAVASSASSSGTAAAGAEEPEACDIDARLQALQSFLKQTKHIAT